MCFRPSIDRLIDLVSPAAWDLDIAMTIIVDETAYRAKVERVAENERIRRFVEMIQLACPVKQIWSPRDDKLGRGDELEYGDMKIDRLTIPRYVR